MADSVLAARGGRFRSAALTAAALAAPLLATTSFALVGCGRSGPPLAVPTTSSPTASEATGGGPKPVKIRRATDTALRLEADGAEATSPAESDLAPTGGLNVPPTADASSQLDGSSRRSGSKSSERSERNEVETAAESLEAPTEVAPDETPAPSITTKPRVTRAAFNSADRDARSTSTGPRVIETLDLGRFDPTQRQQPALDASEESAGPGANTRPAAGLPNRPSISGPNGIDNRSDAAGSSGPPRGTKIESVEPALPAVWPVLPDPIREPKVVLSAYHARRCRLEVGQRLPDFAIADVAGQPQRLQELLGPELTLVVYWTPRNDYSLEQFQRLRREIEAPYAGVGVSIVTITTSSAEEVTPLVAETAVRFPVLCDAGGRATAVTLGNAPCTILVDRTGKILWFDLEYSRSMRRELLNAIHYYGQTGSRNE